MNQLYNNSVFQGFSVARGEFESLAEQLQTPETQNLEHADIEALINQKGKEILRCLFQEYLNFRAHNEERLKKLLGKDGNERTHFRRGCKRNLATLFGNVKVSRCGYGSRSLFQVFPLDKKLNLPPDKYSQGLRGLIAEGVAMNSFEEVAHRIEKQAGIKVPKRQIEEVAREIGQDMAAYYAQVNTQVATDSSSLLIMSVDGKGVVMRQEDLRESTQKAAKKQKHRLQTRLSRGEKRYRKRIATVASIYDVAPYERTAEEILHLNDAEEEKLPRPKVFNKRVWASVEKEAEEVVEDVLQEAEKRDPEHRRTWIILVDGQEIQLRVLERVIERHGVKVEIIQDVIHVLEYLWKAAYCFYDPGSEEAEGWVRKHVLEILKGKASHVAAGMRRSATRKCLKQKERVSVDKCANYLLKNKRRLPYDMALKKGWPIATGVVEGACRYLIKDRIDITGARWSLKGAEAVLRLRALKINGDLENYLDFYRQQESLRHYGPKQTPELYEQAA
jgi:hypothetical protein